ncbi:MAG TPA: hypothetical protein VK174_06940 [Chitinophagales bacterium]|nr:hypothetical protein [Chitinophagales bacterium]
MKNAVIAIVFLSIGLSTGFLGNKWFRKPEPILADSPAIKKEQLNSHLYRLLESKDTFFLVAYETTLKDVKSTEAKFATFTVNDPLTVKYTKQNPEGLVFSSKIPATNNGYKTLPIHLDTLPVATIISTDGKGGLQFISKNEQLTIPVGSLISLNNDATGIVVGYVDQNDIDKLR